MYEQTVEWLPTTTSSASSSGRQKSRDFPAFVQPFIRTAETCLNGKELPKSQVNLHGPVIDTVGGRLLPFQEDQSLS